MAETPAEPPTPGRLSTPRTPADGTPGRLATERGTTTIADVVVTKVAGLAAREVGGVHRLGGAVARALGAVTQRVGVADPTTQGVSVTVTDTEAAVLLTVVVEFGESIPEVARQIRENVIRRIEATTGLRVTTVDITVSDLYAPGDPEDESS